MKFSGKVGNGPVSEKLIKLRSGSRIWVPIRIRIRIATLVRHALAKVGLCTVPVLLVIFTFVAFPLIFDFYNLSIFPKTVPALKV